jgi:putative RNA 2'-phosphotransferase
MRKELIGKSKFLSLVLRHCPDQANLTLDENGWTPVSDVLRNVRISQAELDEIIATNDKKRFELKDNGQSIRACQGHSVQVDLALIPENPPNTLYHGTCSAAMSAILQNGISKMKRTHVHLSSNLSDAVKVGSRHGNPVVFDVNAKQMSDDGIVFYKSTNGVWLTDFVDKKYFRSVGAAGTSNPVNKNVVQTAPPVAPVQTVNLF